MGRVHRAVAARTRGGERSRQRTGSPAPPLHERAQIEAEVRQGIIDRMDTYQEAVMNGDLETVASFWTSDARMLMPGMDMAGADLHAYIREVFPPLTATKVGDELLDLYDAGRTSEPIVENMQRLGKDPSAIDIFLGIGRVFHFSI